MPAAPDVNVASDPAPQTVGELPGFKFNLGHQETDRIVDELEQVCKQVLQSAGDSWMTCTAAANIMCNNLGYEDQGELEVRARPPLRAPSLSSPCVCAYQCVRPRPPRGRCPPRSSGPYLWTRYDLAMMR